MSLQDDIKTVLDADAPLVALATGGIITYDELGGYGLTYKSYPDGYDSNHQLMYVVVVRERSQIGLPVITDEAAQEKSYSEAVEVGFFANRALSYSVVETMQKLVYGLLSEQRIGSTHLIWNMNGRMDRAYTLDNAIAVYSLYDGFGVLSPS